MSPALGFASNPPTLREIARLAKTSHTTVSLSLRNHPSIPPGTRERVCRIATQLGYRPNVLISALMSQVRLKVRHSSLEVIAFLTGGASAHDWKEHSASVGFYEGAQRRANEVGMRVEPFWLGRGGISAAATCRVLLARGIHGGLITPFPVPVYEHDPDWEHLTCVGLGYVYNHLGLHRATHNHFRGAIIAYENLARLGYRRIGLMLDSEDNGRVNYTWLGGYLAAQNMAGLPAIAPLLTVGSGDHTRISAWLELNQPDAVIGFGPKEYFALIKAGYRIPRDLVFAALDTAQTKMAQLLDVAGINQNLPLIGATAIDILASQLYHNTQGLPERPVYSMIVGHWTDGRTAPPASKRTTPRKSIAARADVDPALSSNPTG